MKRIILLIFSLLVITGCTHEKNTSAELTPERASAIAKEAYIFAYPMLGDRLLRAAAAMVGIYANDKIEAFYPIAYVDANGEVLNGAKNNYKIHFTGIEKEG